MNIKNKLKEIEHIDKGIMVIAVLLIMFMLTIVQMFSGIRMDKPILEIVFAILHDTAYLVSIMVYFKYPIITMFLTFFSNICFIVSDIIQGKGVVQAFENCGVIEIMSWLIMPIVLIQTIRKLSDKPKKKAKSNKQNRKQRFKAILAYSKEPIQMKWWQELIGYCLIAAVILKISNTYTFGISDKNFIARLVAVAVLALTTVVTVLRYIRVSMFYKLISFMEILKAISLFVIADKSEIYFESVTYLLIEMLVVVFSTIVYYNSRVKENADSINGDTAKWKLLIKLFKQNKG